MVPWVRSKDNFYRTPQMKSSRYAESGYLSAASKMSPNGTGEANGSQMSLTSSSSSLYSSVWDVIKFQGHTELSIWTQTWN